VYSVNTEDNENKCKIWFFRTLFQSTGFYFISVPSDVLHGLIDYIYTGNLFLTTGSDRVDTALLYLQAETLLQLNDLKLRQGNHESKNKSYIYFRSLYRIFFGSASVGD